ncbi:MAG: GTPase HflX [Candidatus Dormibacteria bacterium]
MPRIDEFVFAPDTEREVAYLMGLGLPRVPGDELEEEMRELAELVSTAGAEVVGSDVQHLPAPNPKTCYGPGKVEELKLLKGDLGFTTLVCNDELSPRQQRALEDALDMKVLDRTEIILDIFARHAFTHEGRLQVEAAQLRHLLPRLTGGRNLSRLGGGIGTRGPGEQKLEVDRRRIRMRVSQLKREIDNLQRSRSLHRVSRRRGGSPVVAIVGYTNAGKSTLMNILTAADVLVADQVFATLDPTTRSMDMPDGRSVLLTDTVGFIQKLPTDLVAAFRATLEEVTEADVLLHVVDASHASAADQFRSTNEVLEELEAMDKPLVLALNKRDLLPDGATELMMRRGGWEPYEEVVAVSALTGAGLDSLRLALQRLTEVHLVRLELLLPYTDVGVEAAVRRRGRVLQREYADNGLRLLVEVPRTEAGKFQRYGPQAAHATPTAGSGRPSKASKRPVS